MAYLKYKIKTFGCQMNKSDSERIAGFLENLGFFEASQEKEADLVLINTCSVRQKAEDRVYGQVRNLAKLKAKKPNLIIGVTGCMPGRDKDNKLREKLKEADLFFSINQLDQLPKWISEARRDILLKQIDLDNYLRLKPKLKNNFFAFVPIMTGCNNFCSYCVVPYARGREYSRPVKEVLNEIRELVKNGCIEIILLGQNINAYRPEDKFSKENPYKNPFAALLWEVDKINGLKRVHFTAPHPKDMSGEVIDALTLPKHVNYLHLPVQSGDDRVLKKMNRNYTAKDYLKLIENIREKKPTIAIGTDIIVGFPGETKEQFENTVKLYKKCGFDISYTAMYSPRSGTKAFEYKDDVSLEEKKRRWLILQKLMEENTLKKNQKYIGWELSVLVDQYGKGFCMGNSLEMKRVRFTGPKNLVGKIVNIKIKKAKTWELEGNLEK